MLIMELASRLRWILVVAVALLALLLVGWGIFSIARGVFNDLSGSGEPETSQVGDSEVLEAKSTRVIVEGPVVANENFSSYEIEVSQNVVSMRTFKTYRRILVSEKSYKNNKIAYDVFLSSLEKMGVTSRIRRTDTKDDYAEQGTCPTGQTHIFEIDDDLRRWTTTCRGVDGTAGFSMSRVMSLFESQVPDFSELVSDTGL